MYVVMNKLQVKPEARGTVAKAFESTLGHVKDEPGFLAFQLLQSEDDDGSLVVVLHWDSKAGYEAHRASDAFKQAHSGQASKSAHGAMTGHPTTETYEVLVTSHAAGD